MEYILFMQMVKAKNYLDEEFPDHILRQILSVHSVEKGMEISFFTKLHYDVYFPFRNE